ncbi:conserved Plasmodium protein, unknown function [Plasmodium knowlesi strain H]|uniref:Liver stage antigen n=3 Tax=Plasmodium knowlesi TaxID=5850 RepID=A0A5K1U8D1_PLAKH|nr:conserved protein, unknown function [Plasmodium knowlesi strain H]OTN65163.1 Uncharacterized protein PKNOH_S120137600 [Plasmodium knowlesi]CAA9988235.1 conserved protein, unknown function [Plasmodium knowlesi strain H]SBO20164.1 conserved Plasmodium protein, unknown function [Plasmodium knowlesi strain H]SBO20528.1 conserved Plasmodium protein, unknown function [Plasmodium knowlesi strain H]VVS77709.1 conserved protein, unknown function [Plasmodium knowlesi strain H]|eukprot:XP_002259212.1 hypothetical protein, conserved in Plasmodium species [Plasmodium knowlesi strain H]
MSSFWSFIKSKKNDDNESKPTVAHLGEENKFYFNKELKRWVIKGEEDKVENEEKVSAPPKMSTLQNANQGYRSLMQQNKTRSARTIYAEIPGLKTIKKKSINMQGGILSPYMMDSAKNELSSNTTDENRSDPFGSNMFIPSVKAQEKKHIGEKSPPGKNTSDAEFESSPKFRGKEEGEIIKGNVDNAGVDNKMKEIMPSGVGQMKRDIGGPLKQLNGQGSKQESNIPSVEKSIFSSKIHMESESKSNLSRENILNSSTSNDRGESIPDSYGGNGVSSESIPKVHELKAGFHSFNQPSGVNIQPNEVRSDKFASSIKREDRSSSFYGDMGLGFNEGKEETPPLSRGLPPVAPPKGGTPPVGGVVNPVYFERIERGGKKFGTTPNGTYNGRVVEDSQRRAPTVGANGKDSWIKSNDDIGRSIPVRPPFNMYPIKTMAEEDVLANGVNEQNEKVLSMSGKCSVNFYPQKEEDLIEHFLSTLNDSLIKEEEGFKCQLKLETEKLHLNAEERSALDTLYRKMSHLKNIKEESEKAEVVSASDADEAEDQSKLNNMLHLINSKNKKIKGEIEMIVNSYNELRKIKTKNEEIIRMYKEREKKCLHMLKEIEEKERRRSASFKKKEKMYQEEILEREKNLQLEITNREKELERMMREHEVSLRMKEEELEVLLGKEGALKEELKKIESEAERKVSMLKDEFERRRTKEMEELKNQQRELTKGKMVEEVRGELRDELINEVTNDLRGELKNQVMTDLRGELINEVMNDLRGELTNEVMNELRTELKDQVMEELRIQVKDEVAGDLEKAKKIAEDNFNSKLEKYKEKMEENKNEFINNLIIEKNNEMEALRCQLEKMKNEEILQLKEEQQRALNENMEQMRKSLLEEHEQNMEELKQEYELQNSREIEALRCEVNMREEEVEKLTQMKNSQEERLTQLENSHEENLAQLHGQVDELQVQIDKLHGEMNQMEKEKGHLEVNIALLKEEKENAMNRNQNLEDNLKNNEEIHNKRVSLLQEEKEKLEKEIKEIIQNKKKESEEIREKFAELLQAEINRIKKESEQKVNTYVKQYEELSEEYETKKKEFSDLLEKANSNNKDLNKKYEENIIKINEYEGMIKMLENQTEQMVRNKIEELNEEFEKKKEIFEKEKKDLLQNCLHLEESQKKMKQQLEKEINLAIQEKEQNILRITNTYESRVQEMEKRCEHLMSQCNELKMKNDEMMENFYKENEQLTTQNDQLSDNLNEVKNELSTLQDKYEQVASQNAHLKNSEQEQQKLSYRFSDLKNINRDLLKVTEKERELNIKNVNIIKSLQEQIKEQTNLYKEYTDELKDEIEKLKRLTESESNSTLSQLFNENKKLKLQNEVITTKSETMSAALDSLTRRLSFIEASIRDKEYGQEVIRRADGLQSG